MLATNFYSEFNEHNILGPIFAGRRAIRALGATLRDDVSGPPGASLEGAGACPPMRAQPGLASAQRPF